MTSQGQNSSDVESPDFWPHLGLSGLPKNVVERLTDFNNPKQEYTRNLLDAIPGAKLL